MAMDNQLALHSLDVWTSVLFTKSSAGRGGNGKLEAYGIKKLRELILELAVRGKLVPQDSNDEPASVLLERIEKEKARLVKEGKLGAQKPLPEVAKDDKHYELPIGWTWTRLGEVTNYGVTDKAEPKDVNEGTWVLDLEDVEKETSRLLTKSRFAEKPFRSSKNRFSSGDVIYGKLRPYLDKVLVADEDGVCTTEMVPVRGLGGIYPFYLRLVMKTPHFIKFADDSTHGMNLPRLGTDKARMALFPLAPLAEQHRIVAKVDELMALCDQLEQQQTDSLAAHETLVETLLGTLTRVESQREFSAAWARIASHFDTLFTTEASIEQLEQTILQLVVMGKLNNSSISKRVTLSELIELISGQHLLADEQNTEGRGIPYLTGPSDFGDKHPIPTRWTDSPKAIAQPGDILVTVKGSGVGKTNKLVAGSTAISRQLMAVRVIGANPDFIHLVLQHAAAHFQAAMTGIAIPGIGRKDVLSLETNLPPLEEQQRIVAKVDELMALCEALKSRLADAETTQLHLADAIVEHAVC